MELHCKLISRLPEETVRLLGIDENTAFETYFEDGAIIVCPHPEWKEDEAVCDGNCEACVLIECCPYESNREDGAPASFEVVLEEDDNGDEEEDDDEDDDECIPGSEDCKLCEHYCGHCGRCVLEDGEAWDE